MSRTARASGEVSRVRSRQLHEALSAFAEEAATRLRAVLAAGDEVPFELTSQTSRGRGAAPLYSYRPLTAEFVAQRFGSLLGLTSQALAANSLAQFDGLDRYLLSADAGRAMGGPHAVGSLHPGGGSRTRIDAALLAFLQDVFGEQTDFELRPERLAFALGRIDGSAVANPALLTLIATLHGLAIASEELRLTSNLLLAQPHALEGLPTTVLSEVSMTALSGASHARSQQPLLVVCTAEDTDANAGLDRCRSMLAELLRSLRLFGDGRIALGPAGHSRVGSGSWGMVALDSSGGHPHGMLLVTPEQEDELRAFCNLISRRAQHDGRTAWALRRYEFGCERAREYDALSDHLLALRALLGSPADLSESAGVPDGLLATRLAALCATPEHRLLLIERTLGALELERAVAAGTAAPHAGGLELARELANHLRALLRDQICGHLPEDLATLAHELLIAEESVVAEEPLMSGEGSKQMSCDEPQSVEVLDLAV